MATVLVVRHGETTWNRDGRVQGWADTALTDRGRRQARATGRRLADRAVDRLVVSDLARTRETADCMDLPVEPRFSRAWRERGFGDYQGLTREAIADRHEGYDPDGSLLAVPDVPGGESLDAVRERVVDGWERVRADLDGTAVVVTHGGPIRALLAHLTGRDLATLAAELSPVNCGITEIEIDRDARVVRTDDAAHLD